MATSKMYTCIELPHIPRNDDGGRAIKEFTVDNLLRGVLRHHTGGRILETTLNDIHTAARRELNLRVARKEGDFLLKKIRTPEAFRLWKDVQMSAIRYCHVRGDEMKDVVGFATGHNAVEVYDPASGVTVSVASYCSTALVDLDYKTLLEGACKLTSDPGFELVVFNKVWRSLITNDYAYEEESAKAEALSKAEYGIATQIWNEVTGMHQHRTPAFATDHESEREGVVDRIAELLNFAIILPPRNITTFDGFCSAIALLNPFLVMCQGILFELYNARLGNRALVLGKEPEERGESPATKGDTRAMFFRALPSNFNNYWDAATHVAPTKAGGVIVPTNFMIVAQDDGMRIPLCMMDTNTKTSLFVRFVEHIDILNPEETLLFNDYTKLFGSLFTGFSNKQRARSMTQAQEVALFFLMRDEHVGVVGLRILKQREAEITRGLSENQVKEADLKRELRKTTEAIAKHTGGAGLRTLKQQKAEITRSLSETQKKEAELEVELKKTNEAIAKLQPTPSASTAAPQRKRRSSAGKKKPVKGNLSGTSESENESSGCEKDVEYESDRPTPDQNAADESDPDDLGDRLDVEFKPKKLRKH